jgi:AraC family transcriptional regulator
MIIGARMEQRRQVREDLGVAPIAEGMVGEKTPMYCERYFFRSLETVVRGIAGNGLVVQLGGARVREGEQGQWRAASLPGQSILLPAHCETHWHYGGPVDFAVFYLPEPAGGVVGGLCRLAEASGAPLPFYDAVLSANAEALTEELRKGGGADARFMSMLAEVILEQSYRVLTMPATTHIGPHHPHFTRLNSALDFIREHLRDNLSLELLSDRANLSVPHFRRLFHAAMGVTVHRFVLAARLEKARNLLSSTRMPLSRIADECGFSSQSHLATSFRKAHAATPTEFRELITRPDSSR